MLGIFLSQQCVTKHARTVDDFGIHDEIFFGVGSTVGVSRDLFHRYLINLFLSCCNWVVEPRLNAPIWNLGFLISLKFVVISLPRADPNNRKSSADCALLPTTVNWTVDLRRRCNV